MWRVWMVPRMYRTGFDELIMGLELIVPLLIVFFVIYWLLGKSENK
jgi:hypothetical protein